MAAKQKPIKPRDLIKILENKGFFIQRQGKGSQILLKHPDGYRVVIPYHQNKEIPTGTLRAIIKDAGLNKEDLMK